MFLWVRATFPRFRYDQIMRLGWKIFIPVTLVWLVVVGLWIQSPFNIWKWRAPPCRPDRRQGRCCPASC
jgi:NADH-quinone oxidoreductase subunit H